jgi:pimeloyl-ACP methyl ester carboxylesterase
MSQKPSRGDRPVLSGAAQKTLAVGAVLAGAALFVQYRSRKAEQANPPTGKFLTINGVRLHYTDQGKGMPLVILHGNGSMVQDFAASGVVAETAKHFRVISFDRPGFGYSERPRGSLWAPMAQADLLRLALAELGVSEAIVLGHSWGASVAIALALEHPKLVRALVLLSGYYYPTPRLDVALLSGPAIPLVGDVLRYTVAPLLGRLLWTRVARKLFAPASVSRSFAGFPADLAVRPGPLRASAEETLLMIPDAIRYQERYGEIKMPVVILAGDDDEIVSTARQSLRLHHAIPHSSFRSLKGIGHMVQHSVPMAVVQAIIDAEEIASAAISNDFQNTAAFTQIHRS